MLQVKQHSDKQQLCLHSNMTVSNTVRCPYYQTQCYCWIQTDTIFLLQNFLCFTTYQSLQSLQTTHLLETYFGLSWVFHLTQSNPCGDAVLSKTDWEFVLFLSHCISLTSLSFFPRRGQFVKSHIFSNIIWILL